MTLARGEREKRPYKLRQVTLKTRWRSQAIFLTLSYVTGGRVFEVFVDFAKTGSALRTALGLWARTASKAIQYGAPVLSVAKSIADTSEDKVAYPISCDALPHLHGCLSQSRWDVIAKMIVALVNADGNVKDALGPIPEGNGARAT